MQNEKIVPCHHDDDGFGKFVNFLFSVCSTFLYHYSANYCTFSAILCNSNEIFIISLFLFPDAPLIRRRFLKNRCSKYNACVCLNGRTSGFNTKSGSREASFKFPFHDNLNIFSNNTKGSRQSL